MFQASRVAPGVNTGGRAAGAPGIQRGLWLSMPGAGESQRPQSRGLAERESLVPNGGEPCSHNFYSGRSGL